MAAELNKVVDHVRSVLAAGMSDGDLMRRYREHGTRQLSRRWCAGTGRWSWVSAAVSCTTSTMPRTPFRPPSWCWSGKRPASAPQARSATGSMAWLTATARQARRAAFRRRRKEAQVVLNAESPPDAWADLREVLDQELERLPLKYRAAVILCDLEGETGQEA